MAETDRETLNALFGVSDKQLDAEASEYENEAWGENSFGKARPGRPRLYDEDMGVVTLRMPRASITRIEAAARGLGVSRSQFMRDAIDRRLEELAN